MRVPNNSMASTAAPATKTLFSLFATLDICRLNPRLWMSAYLEACAKAGGQAPAEAERFLPWNLSPRERSAWAQGPPIHDSS